MAAVGRAAGCYCAAAIHATGKRGKIWKIPLTAPPFAVDRGA